jgi:hypothetical protein
MDNTQPKKKKQTQNVLDVSKQSVVAPNIPKQSVSPKVPDLIKQIKDVENEITPYNPDDMEGWVSDLDERASSGDEEAIAEIIKMGLKPQINLKGITKSMYGEYDQNLTEKDEFGDEYVGWQLDDDRYARIYPGEDGGEVYVEFYMGDDANPLSDVFSSIEEAKEAIEDSTSYEDYLYEEEPLLDEFEPEFAAPEEVMEGVSNEEVATEEGLETDNLDTLGLQLSELESAGFEVNLDSEGTGFTVNSPSGKQYDVTFDENGQLLFYDYFNQSYDIVNDINDIYQLISLNE